VEVEAQVDLALREHHRWALKLFNCPCCKRFYLEAKIEWTCPDHGQVNGREYRWETHDFLSPHRQRNDPLRWNVRWEERYWEALQQYPTGEVSRAPHLFEIEMEDRRHPYN
jgi:hypothetical protein